MTKYIDDKAPESESLFFHYFNILKKRRSVILSFAGVLVITAIVATIFSTRYYSSSAVIEIMPVAPKIMGEESGEAVSELGARSDSAMRSYYNTQLNILNSHTVLAKAITELRDDHGITDFDELEEPIPFLRQHLFLVPRPDTTLVNIKVEYPEPAKAALFANVIASVYMENNLDRSLTAVKDALKWLEREHERYREAKLNSDEKVHTFKYKNHLVGIEQRANATQAKMKALQKVLSTIQTDRIQVQAAYSHRRQMLRSQSWGALAKEFSLQDRVLQELLHNQAKLQQQKDELSERYTLEHPQLKALVKQLSNLQNRIDKEVEKHVNTHRAKLNILVSKEKAVQTELKLIESQVKELDRKMIELQFLVGEAKRNETLYLALDKRLSEVDLSQFMQSNNVRFVDRAIADDTPVRPSLTMNLLMALLLGAIGGGALAFLVEFLDNTVKTKEDLESMLGVPLLGIVPAIDPEEMLDISSNRDRSIYAFTRSRSTISESLRSIRTNVLFRTGNQPSRTLLVTSAVPREGKSFMSANLSAVIAMAGSRVVLIDADLRRPSIHRLFEISDEFGLSEVLMGTRRLETAIQQSHVPGLDIISAGPIPPNPSELLGNHIMREVLDELAESYDIIIIDSPPATAVADPMILSPLTDGVMLVVEANQTRKPIVMQAITRLRHVQSNIIGGIVNKLDIRKSGYGYYYYYYNDYGYYADEEYESRNLG